MQNEICKLCGKPMFSKFQMGGEVSGSELPMNTPLTSNIAIGIVKVVMCMFFVLNTSQENQNYSISFFIKPSRV